MPNLSKEQSTFDALVSKVVLCHHTSTMPTDTPLSRPASRMRVLVLGATGTIGVATTAALVAEGYDVVCGTRTTPKTPVAGAAYVECDVTDPAALERAVFDGPPVSCVVSCLASRSGAPKDAWAIDHKATVDAIAMSKAHGVDHFVLLSAICVQKPRLHFQHAKIAAETALRDSGLTYSIVRPTAYFKSLSGQIDRVRRGKSYLMFGSGTGTSCTPISDRDLGAFLAGCLTDPARRNAILPIGGPGPARTPLEQGAYLFSLFDQPTKFTRVPIWLLSTVVGALGVLARLVPRLANAAEFARIAQYYATESMLVWDEKAGRYDANKTPAFGTDTLFDHYASVAKGEVSTDLGDHRLFDTDPRADV